MTRAKRSIIATYLIAMLLMATLPVLLVGYLWISDVQKSFHESSEGWQKNHLQKHRSELENQVGDVLSYISFRHSQVSQLLREQLRFRVDEAMVIADVFAKTADSTPQQLGAFITALRHFQLQPQQGAFTILKTDGTLLMGQRKPHLEQKSVLPYFRAEERRAIREAIEQVILKGEIYSTYRAISDKSESNDLRLAFARYHPQLDVIVINHNSLSVVTELVKSEVLQRFGGANAINGSSIFIAEKSGALLVQPSNLSDFDTVLMAGETQPSTVDALWRAVSDRDIKKEKRFVQYEWRNSETGQTLPAMSYLKNHPDWQWVVGAEMPLLNFYRDLAEHRAEFDQSIRDCMMFILAVLVACILLVSFVAYRFYRVNAKGFQGFIEFFDKACVKTEPIDTDDLPYSEFKQLANHANRMLADRESYEQALKKSRQRFRLALQASNSYMWDLDFASRQLNFSNHFFHMLGYHGVAENVGYPLRGFFDLCHPDERASVEKSMLQDAEALAESGLEFRIKNAAGDYRWFYSRGGVIDENGVGQANRLAGIITDIHERKSLECDLQQAHVEVEEASYVREQFLSSMSHELHTPLNNILGHVQLLQRDPIMKGEQKQQLKLAEDAGYYLLRLINDILELSRIDSGNSPVQMVEYSIVELAQTLCDKMVKKAKIKGLSLEIELDPKLPKLLLLDGFKLKQILVGLMSNAIKYTEQGLIRLEIKVLPGEETNQQDRVQFDVIDTGVGIADDMKKTVFQPFTQLGGANAFGTGLGLPIALRLAKSIGARLELDSELGRGSIFSLRLPLEATTSDLLGEQPNVLVKDDVDEAQGLQVVGLAQEQHQNLYYAAKMGDIETLQDIFKRLEESGFGEHDWLKHCKQLLSHFDLESLLRFLDNTGTNNEALV